MRAKTCVVCGGKMVSIGSFSLQKGQYSLLLGHLSHLVGGALDVGAMCCESCRRLDFYLLEDEAELPTEEHIAQVECPFCGVMHDLDDAVCPHCRQRLMD